MNWVQLAGSLAAVFAIAAIVWWMGMGKSPKIENGDHAMQLARDAHSGFRPVEAIVDQFGRAALIRSEDGEYVLLRAHGAQIAARVFREPPAAQYEGDDLTIITDELMFGQVRLAVEESEAQRWLPPAGAPSHA